MAIRRAAVLEGIVRHWRGNARLRNAVPGGLHEGRPAAKDARGQATPMPYARLMVTEGERENTSGGYLQPFKVEISAWDKEGATSSAAVTDAVAKAFDWAGQRTGTETMTVSGATVIHVRPLPGGQSMQATRDAGKDVRIAGGAWELLLFAVD